MIGDFISRHFRQHEKLVKFIFVVFQLFGELQAEHAGARIDRSSEAFQSMKVCLGMFGLSKLQLLSYNNYPSWCDFA